MCPDGLRKYQVKSAADGLAILQRYGGLLDASDTGVGKTYTTLAIARELGIAPLVVCPRTVKSAWHRVAAHLGGQCHTINYESLKGDMTEWGVLVRPPGYNDAAIAVKQAEADLVRGADNPNFLINLQKMRKNLKLRKAQCRYEWAAGIPLIEFDEVHRCKAPDSFNSKMLSAAKRQKIPFIMSSATPMQTPLDMKAIGYALNLHNGVGFWDWCRRNGCKPGRFGGLEFVGGDRVLRQINSLIFPDRGIRITREELGEEFPTTQITAELYDLNSGAGKIDALYKEMAESLAILRAKTAGDADLEHPLTQLMRARQEVELIKVPVFVDLIESHLEQGFSVAVFVNFKETMAAIKERFPSDRYIATVEGQQEDWVREAGINNFQIGRCRLILCNLQAGGVGISLHDTTGQHPRVSLISPTYSALDLTQCLGRVWRNGGHKSLQRIVLAAGTVEERIHRKLSRKLNNISLITDGDLSDLL